MSDALPFVIAGYLAGSLPCSPWLARAAGGHDLSQVADGNPGATNVLRTAGWGWGLLALMLDISKGVVPVALATWHGEPAAPWIAALLLAPPLGHATSPWLRGRGGKAIACTCGTWLGLTQDWIPFAVAGLLVLFWKLVTPDAWAVACTWLAFLALLLVVGATSGWLLGWGAQAALLAWKHWADLRRVPSFQFGRAS